MTVHWVQVIPSKDIKVAGLLGPAARLEKKSINVADTEVCVQVCVCMHTRLRESGRCAHILSLPG